MVKILYNLFVGFISVLTAAQASVIQPLRHATMAEALQSDWKGVAKDLKRVQGKLKAEAHDGKKRA